MNYVVELEGTIIQIEKVLINDCLTVLNDCLTVLNCFAINETFHKLVTCNFKLPISFIFNSYSGF